MKLFTKYMFWSGLGNVVCKIAYISSRQVCILPFYEPNIPSVLVDKKHGGEIWKN